MTAKSGLHKPQGMMKREKITGILFVLSMLPQASIGGKVLVLSMQMSGHLSEFAAIGNELTKMGHDVYVVLDENIGEPAQLRNKGLKYLHYRSYHKERVSIKAFDMLFSKVALGENWDEWEFLHKVYRPRVTNDCNLTLSDENLYHQIQKMNFDVALVEGLYFCYHLLPYRLGIPIITLSTALYPGLTKVYPPFSVISCAIRRENTLWNRMVQLFRAFLEEDFARHCLDEKPFLNYIPNEPLGNLYEIASKTKLWLICLDEILDCPCPAMPNVKYVGGIDVEPAKPLPDDLEMFARDAKEGIIVVSFGSMLSTPPKSLVHKFLSVFDRLKQGIIWRLSEKAQEGIEFPNHVKPMTWLPQNDLLGHNNTQLFITHSGNNGQWEAFYHGVPMLGFPTFGDQGFNTDRMVMKGFGLGMNIREFTTEELFENINEILKNATYRENIRRESNKFRSKEHPRKVAAGYVDYAIKFGLEDFQSAATDLTYAQFLMLDIYGIVLLVLVLLAAVIKYLLSFIFSLFRTKKDKDLDKKNI